MTQTVFLVDDDAAVRAGLGELLAAHGVAVRTFASAEEFITAVTPNDAGCVLLDQRLPGMSGLELQAALARAGIDLPIIFLTGYGDVPSTVQAMRGGAIDYLQKPPAGEVLVARVRAAFALDEQRRTQRARRCALRGRFATLTARERDVLALAAKGLANKEIARKLAISHRTVETHRSRVMHKLNVNTLFELIDVAQACGGAPASAPQDDDPTRSH